MDDENVLEWETLEAMVFASDDVDWEALGEPVPTGFKRHLGVGRENRLKLYMAAAELALYELPLAK